MDTQNPSPACLCACRRLWEVAYCVCSRWEAVEHSAQPLCSASCVAPSGFQGQWLLTQSRWSFCLELHIYAKCFVSTSSFYDPYNFILIYMWSIKLNCLWLLPLISVQSSVASWRSCHYLGLEIALVWIIHHRYSVFRNPHLMPRENGLGCSCTIMCVGDSPAGMSLTTCIPVRFPGDRNYIQLWAIMCVGGRTRIEPSSSGRVVGALKH